MKICIIGPVNSDKSYGGVALFTESIADGFKQQGHEVLIITDYSNRNSTLKGTPIKSVSNKVSRKSFSSIKKIRNYIHLNKPDLTISSLEYSVALLKKIKNIRSVHFIHGFPSVKHYGLLKMLFMLILDKMYSKKFDYIFINSNFAYMINNDIYKNRIDEVINIGLGYDFLEELQERKEIINNKNSKLLFVGRLVEAKKVDVIILALNYIKEKYNLLYELNIVGNGPEEKKLTEMAEKYKLNINFVGSVNPKETIRYYRNSEIFISLNPHEPFGMVYLEALANGCKIVCPNSGGQLDFLLNHLDRVNLTKAYDYVSVGESIIELLNKDVGPIDYNLIVDKYSYDNVVKRIVEVI